jgi:hypothetical protein
MGLDPIDSSSSHDVVKIEKLLVGLFECFPAITYDGA